MAKNIELMGAVFPDVPSILIPQHEGGLVSYVDVTDTTASASDVSTGKYFYTADGTRTAGTNSGGGGGASNVVQGTFTTESTRKSTGTFTIPYTGNGYPIALMVFVKGGVYNPTSSGNSQWYQSTNRYDVGQYCMVKSAPPIEPDYSSGAYAQGAVSIIYKNSTSISTTYSGTRSVSASTYGKETDSAQASTLCVRFKGNGTTVSYFIGNLSSSTIGLAPNTEYAYIAVYSE